jgi:adenine-specific DNA-methyltransferase
LSAENPDSSADLGYRAFKIDTSNSHDVLRRPDELGQDELDLLEASVKADRTSEDLLFQVLLDWGLELSLPIEQIKARGQEAFIVDGGALIACFESSVTAETVRAIADLKPLRAVFRDSAFDSDKDRINAEQIFAEVSPGTDVKVI